MSKQPSDLNLNQRLLRIEKLEDEIIRKSAGVVGRGTGLSFSGMFVIGATKKILAQAKGFRELICSKNFPCAAAILRMQIDTAMRVNGLLLVENMDATCQAVLEGKKFSRLKDREGNKLTDYYLKEKICEQHPWIGEVYNQTSDFVHLSGRLFYNSIAHTDDKTRMVYLMVSGSDAPKDESCYFEVVDTFFKITKIAGILTLGYFLSRSGESAPRSENDRACT